MDPNDQDVTPSAPSADPDATQDAPESSAAAVTAVDDDAIVGDRPLKNYIAELERKAAQREERLKMELLAAISAAQRPQAPAQPQSREYSDEELSQLAAAGDARALQMLTDRQAARHAAQQTSAYSQQQADLAQLNALMGRYPVLRDGSHSLTQYATQVKLALLARGAQDTAATVIEAIKTAIADNPDLAAQSAVRMTSPSVPRATAPVAGAAAPAPRRTPQSPARPAATLSDKEWEVAKRMGYSTREQAAKAKENFQRRQTSGQSRLGAVGAMIREEN
jgi:hypothetical protein